MSNKNNLKNTLEARELPPSPQAWDKLDAQLTEHIQTNTEEKASKPKFTLWLKIAASAIILIVVSVIFNIENNTPLSDPKLTHTEPPITEKQSNESEQTIPLLDHNKKEYSNYPEPNVVRSTPSKTLQTQQNQQHEQSIDSSPKKTQKETASINMPYLETNNASLLAAQDSMHKKKNYEKLPSADELLEQAMLKRQENQQNAIAVDSKKLLDAVEDDVFHEKSPDLLEKLTQQIKSLHVAIHERNEEK